MQHNIRYLANIKHQHKLAKYRHILILVENIHIELMSKSYTFKIEQHI